MAINLMCPNLRCRKVLAVPENTRGTRVRCAYCHQIFLVPSNRTPIFAPKPKAPPAVVTEDAKVGNDKKVK